MGAHYIGAGSRKINMGDVENNLEGEMERWRMIHATHYCMLLKNTYRIIILKLIDWKDFYKSQMAIASWELLVNNNEGFHCRRLARLLKFLFCLSKENEKQIGQNICGIYSKQWEYFSRLCTFPLYSKMSLEYMEKR